MKILERKNTLRTVDGGAPLAEKETLERLRVPDDLSGLADVPSIGEPGGLPAAEPRRAVTLVRWLRWLPLFVLAVAGAVVAAILMTDASPATEAPWTANDGPGGHTLNVPELTLTAVPWNANDGPGGHTLNVPELTLTAVPWTANDGPGGHSLDMTDG